MHDFAIRLPNLHEEPRTGLSFLSCCGDATSFFWMSTIFGASTPTRGPTIRKKVSINF